MEIMVVELMVEMESVVVSSLVLEPSSCTDYISLESLKI